MGRVLTWTDPKIVEMARENFIPVAADDWYQRRRQDDEGEFFRMVADQGPRQGATGGTRQGIYVFSAGGILLGFKNHQDPAVMRQFLLDSLKNWQRLPARERVPRAVEVAPIKKIDRQYQRELPEGGLIVNVFTRILDRTDDGGLGVGQCGFPGGDRPAHDHLWLLPDDVNALLAGAKSGTPFAVPERLTARLARFHLVDNTRGEPPTWTRGQVRTAKLNATPDQRAGGRVTLKIDGEFALSTSAAGNGERGYAARLLGYVVCDLGQRSIERFDLAVLGDHWGSGPYTRGARPGRTPLGIVFELSKGGGAADRVPPQGAREWNAYVFAEK